MAGSFKAIKPALCKLHLEPFNSPDWIWEQKYDGARIIAHTATGILQARSGSNKTLLFPEIIVKTTLPAIVDGELVSASGLSFQEGVQPRINRLESISHMAEKLPATFVAFDIIELNGNDLRRLPLSKRKAILSNVLIPTDTSDILDFSPDGLAMYALAERNGWEGIVGKHLDSPYEDGKRRWLKVKVWQYGEFWAVGFTNGTGKRSGCIGALMLEDDSGNSVGEVGTGFNDSELSELTHSIQQRMADDSMYKFRVKVKYLERTITGKLRFPVMVSYQLP